MQGTTKKILRFLNGDDKRFIIPVYQRNYDWKVEQCSQLFDDLVDVIKNDRKTHFFGSIISINDIAENFFIIDGQQRLTTVSILLLAICNAVKDGKVESDDLNFSNKVAKKYLIDEYAEFEDKRMKLKTIKRDREAYSQLFKNEKLVKSSDITNNYLYFYNRIINEKELNPDELLIAIDRLEIIDIALRYGEDDPQLIFESINSTGLALSESDKIRNYILMGLSQKQQEEFYENYWNVIEINTNYEVSSFIRNYLTIKTNKIPVIAKVYMVFKNYIKKYGVNVIDVLKEMKEYSETFKTIINADCNLYEVNLSLKRIKHLESTVVYPYLIEVFNYYKEGHLTDSQLTKVCETVESYVGRRIICAYPTNAMNKVFATLHYDCMRLKGNDHGDYVERLIHVLMLKQGVAGIPKDNEVKKHIEELDFYNLQFRNKIYILEKLENGSSKEYIDIYGNDNISIEHIMPQNISKWKKYLGDNANEIHSKWIHKLANLTLTAYNSKYSDLPFEDKKTMKDGFNDSGFRLNRYVAKQDEWKEKQLIERQELLINECIKTWPLYENKFEPEIIEHLEVAIDDEFEFTGTKPLGYSFLGHENVVSTWKDLTIEIIKIIHGTNKSILYRIMENKEELCGWFNNTDKNNHYSFIDEELYVWLNTDTFNKVKLLNSLLPLYEIEPSDLIVTLDIKVDNEDVEK